MYDLMSIKRLCLLSISVRGFEILEVLCGSLDERPELSTTRSSTSDRRCRTSIPRKAGAHKSDTVMWGKFAARVLVVPTLRTSGDLSRLASMPVYGTRKCREHCSVRDEHRVYWKWYPVGRDVQGVSSSKDGKPETTFLKTTEWNHVRLYTGIFTRPQHTIITDIITAHTHKV